MTQENKYWMHKGSARLIVFDAVNLFPSKGFPIDEYNSLALDRVKSMSALSTRLAVKGLSVRFQLLINQISHVRNSNVPNLPVMKLTESHL